MNRDWDKAVPARNLARVFTRKNCFVMSAPRSGNTKSYDGSFRTRIQ